MILAAALLLAQDVITPMLPSNCTYDAHGKVNCYQLSGQATTWTQCEGIADPCDSTGKTARVLRVDAPPTVQEIRKVQLLAVPIPMETVRERLDIKRSPVGLWNFALSNDTDQPATISREKLQILMATWCDDHGKPIPLLLTKEQAWPIITRKAGGRWKTVQRLVTYASLGVAISGVPIAAAAGPVLELVSGGAGQRIPDISALTAELPAVIVIPPHSGVTLSAWSSKMATRPQVIGPVLVR
jgi:hypothetical protein